MSRNACSAVVVGLILLLGSGCAFIAAQRPPESPAPAWTLDSYALWIKENMAAIDACYTDSYAPYPFVVDTDKGARRVQDLIDPEAVCAIPARLGLRGAAVARRITLLHRWVLDHCTYTAQPQRWSSAAETLRTRRSDCKGLSLLLLSLLLCADVPAHAAVANGHMWVQVDHNGRLQVLELDQDPRRRRIYGIPGFYRKPLYRIYADRTLKRIRRDPPGGKQANPAPPAAFAPESVRPLKVP